MDTTMISYLVIVILLAVISLNFNEIKFKMKLKTLRKKGYKQDIHIKDDMTVTRYIAKPDDNNQLKIEGRKYTIDPDTVYWDHKQMIQTVITFSGSQKTISLKHLSSGVDPRLIGMLALESYFAGEKDKKDKDQKLKLIVQAGIFVILGLLALGYLTFQNTNELIGLAKGTVGAAKIIL